MFCTIYKICNNVNDKIYVGQTWQTIQKRWALHCYQHGCIKLANAIKKYGKENFTIHMILVTHTQDIADYWEDFFIQKFNSIECGYNIKSGGSHGKMSKESILKMSVAHIGKKLSEEAKNKKSEFMKGNDYALGKKYSSSTREKMSNSQKIIQSGEGNNAAKLTWTAVNEIRSSRESSKNLADKFGISIRTISDIRMYRTWKN